MRARDGVQLQADVYRPAEHGQFPVILIRTPYDKEGVPSGADQGLSVLRAASQSPPALRAMATPVTPASFHGDLGGHGGATQLGGTLFWSTFMSMDTRMRRGLDMLPTLAAMADWDALYRHLPINEQPHLAGVAPHFFSWLAHPNYDAFWKCLSLTECYERVQAPGFQHAGWFDIFLQGNLTHYAGMKARGGSALERANQRLVIGPWVHAMTADYPEREFGQGGWNFLPFPFNNGPRDQRAIGPRVDVLTYTSAPMAAELEVTGPLTLVLHVSSSCVDTDFTAKLIDVYPDGRALLLADGIRRMRYRETLDTPKLMTPGAVYEARIDLVATSNVFKIGHRIRLEVSSSNFPKFSRNSNSGGDIASEPAEAYRAAVNRVVHDAARPSHLLLPVIARG